MGGGLRRGDLRGGRRGRGGLLSRLGGFLLGRRVVFRQSGRRGRRRRWGGGHHLALLSGG